MNFFHRIYTCLPPSLSSHRLICIVDCNQFTRIDSIEDINFSFQYKFCKGNEKRRENEKKFTSFNSYNLKNTHIQKWVKVKKSVQKNVADTYFLFSIIPFGKNKISH